ncbi:MAG: carboxypeptidase-like regulatory domain-containing protein [Planctomycetaceae bacterium]|jgi:hypothetical protein
MRKHTLLTKAASIAVCFGILLTNVASAFDGVPTQVARDIELTADGALQGQIYSPEGLPVSRASVELRYQGTPIARTTTGAQGEFLITGVRGGAHELTIGSMSTPVRLWKNGTAPEGAVDGVVVAASENVVRGQSMDTYGNPSYPPPTSGFGLIDVVTLAMLGTSVAALIIAIDTHEDVEELEDALVSP